MGIVANGWTMIITMLRPPIDVERAVLPALRDFPHQRQDHAPYGIIWYIVNLPLGKLSETATDYIVYTGIITGTIITLGLTLSLPDSFILLFAGISIFNLVKAPWNCSILWLCLLGLFNPLLLAVPILAKLPVGNLKVEWWQTRQALFWQKNPVYWGSLVIVWLAVLIIRLPINPMMFA